MKYWWYLKYVLRHKWFVGQACFRYGILWRGIVHDWSKFLPDEFIPYAEFFYGDWRSDASKNLETNRETREAFDRAWLKHQHRSDHHWQSWVLREDSGLTKYLEMPHDCVLEMLADWEGAGLAITGTKTHKTWYEKNRERILLHPVTRELVEELLEACFHGAGCKAI